MGETYAAGDVLAALDYLVLYNLQEMANPGYLKRVEKRIERENGQTFLFPPSQYAVGQ